jgi:hypothetical protein
MTETKTSEPIEAEFTDDLAAGSREIAHREERGQAVASADLATFNAATMLQMVERLALDERVDAGKLETVMRVANQQQDREREIQFYQDKNRAVREMPAIRKDGRIVIAGKNGEPDRVQGHFEKWADVQAAVTPVLDRHNLVLTHKIDHADGQTVVIAVLTHDNGFREESGPMRLPLDTSGGKNNVQGAGSSQTYGMRYTTRAICGLKLIGGQGDDDGLLIPLPDEPLNDQQQRRLREAEALWAQSEEAFEEWYSRLQVVDRVWFVQSGKYAEITGRQALPGVQRIADAHNRAEASQAASEGAAPASDGQPGKQRETAEQWVERYEKACREAGSLDALAALQDKAKRAIDRIKQSGKEDLHQRAITAGSDAYARLSGGDKASASDDDLFGGEAN